jgi:hypothetical protein
MAQEETIEDIIDRIQRARDRCVNASDAQGIQDADQALADLRGLDSSSMPTARDVEEFFNERAGRRAKGEKTPLEDPSTGRAASTRSRVLSSDDDFLSDNS